MGKGHVMSYKHWDDCGRLTGLNSVRTSTETPMFDLKLSYQYNTNNLLSRTGMFPDAESFEYDVLDRLTSAKNGNVVETSVKYSANGNISYKTNVGNYEYGLKPHAVMSVENPNGIIPSATLTTQFNEIGKVCSIEDGNTLQSLRVEYGPDFQRWISRLYRNKENITRIYFDDYEKTFDSAGIHEFYYLNDYVICKRDDEGEFKYYFVNKDNLGSIVNAYDFNGEKVFDATYDAWGKQTVTLNKIGLYRGYCGHEMLNDFDVVNMNGRLYDPVLGRFFSPDNYVQMPDNSQNFNRYSYCLNNPLKYTDPSGEIFGIDDWLVSSVAIGAFMGAMEAKISGRSCWKGVLAGGIAGGLASWGGGAISQVLQAGNVWAGAGAGTIVGGLSSAASTLLANGFMNILEGHKFSSGLWNGVWENALSGAVFGGFLGGKETYRRLEKSGVEPWSGKITKTEKHYENIVGNFSFKQEDPTKYCYAYAGGYAERQIGGEYTFEDYINAANGEDGAVFYKTASELKRGVGVLKASNYQTFANEFDLETITSVITVGSDPLHGHCVTLVSFDGVLKMNLFGGGTHFVRSHMKVYDPLTGNVVRKYGRTLVENYMRLK